MRYRPLHIYDNDMHEPILCRHRSGQRWWLALPFSLFVMVRTPAGQTSIHLLQSTFVVRGTSLEIMSVWWNFTLRTCGYYNTQGRQSGYSLCQTSMNTSRCSGIEYFWMLNILDLCSAVPSYLRRSPSAPPPIIKHPYSINLNHPSSIKRDVLRHPMAMIRLHHMIDKFLNPGTTQWRQIPAAFAECRPAEHQTSNTDNWSSIFQAPIASRFFGKYFVHIIANVVIWRTKIESGSRSLIRWSKTRKR